MTLWDWFNAGALALVGLFVGMALGGLIELVAMGAWLLALILLVLGAVMALIVFASEWLSDRLFGIGIKPARNPTPKPRLRRLSLPAGIMVGLILHAMGLSGPILELLP